MEAILALEDGRVFRGRSFGASGECCGEVVFNTAMTGYQEVLTDPSYRGQIVCMTFPQIGNVGTNALDPECSGAPIEGFVVREVSAAASSWRAAQALQEFLREYRIPAVSEVDTRALTRHIRSRGAMKGALSTIDRDAESLVQKARRSPGLESQDLVKKVTCSAAFRWDTERDPRWSAGRPLLPLRPRVRCVAYDFGAKRNILRLLTEHNFEVTVVPASTRAEEALAMGAEAVFLSNGPGDPATATYAIEAARGLIGRVPVFGICLGHQIAALAMGAKTFKLKFGHRGVNHPVQDLRTGRVAVTSQNHGYAVVPESLPSAVTVTHVSLNDGTCEGFLHRDARLLAVQYHPESSPGPHDSLSLFREFHAMVASVRSADAPILEGRR